MSPHRYTGSCLLTFAPCLLFSVAGEIKDYFGERIGLYFLFVQYFATALLIPAALGVVVFAIQTYYNVTGYFLMPVFAAYMTVWGSYFVENWKQVQSTAAMEWGVTGKTFYARTDLFISVIASND